MVRMMEEEEEEEKDWGQRGERAEPEGWALTEQCVGLE